MSFLLNRFFPMHSYAVTVEQTIGIMLNGMVSPSGENEFKFEGRMWKEADVIGIGHDGRSSEIFFKLMETWQVLKCMILPGVINICFVHFSVLA